MPYVLKHKQTTQIATDTLINKYDLPYYGTKFWDVKADAEQESDAFLQTKDLGDLSMWEIIEVEEGQMKLFNVKLKNDSSLRLYLDNQFKAVVRTMDN